MRQLIFILILIALIKQIICITPVNVNTNHGKIIGYKETVEGKELNIFLGIPYAEPPLNDLRFKKPVPIKSWKEPINATKWSNICYQRDDPILTALYKNKNMSEDCLYLNVFAPSTNTGHLKPVMFWIHGGAFLAGTAGADIYIPDILSVRGDVIVVSINYRLNSFGFLYTGTDDAPGNAGLYDQVMALQWVNDNIAAFGGDNKQITIFGESAGSWSVSLHLLSPLSRNLFKNAIMMSGAVLNHLASEDPDVSKKNWAKGAKLSGCGNGENFTSESINCLKKLDPKKLVEIPELKELIVELAWFIPLVEFNTEFLPKNAIKMLQNGDHKKNVNVLIGTTNDEGSFILRANEPNKFAINSTYNMSYNEARDELKSSANKLKSHIPINADDVVKLYFTGLKNNSNDLKRTIGEAIGDFYLLCPTLLFANGIFKGDEQHNSVYQYFYTQKPTIANTLCGNWTGACHGSDLIAWFGFPFRMKPLFTDDDRSHSTILMNLLTQFAKNGSPPPQDGIQWSKYYTINSNTITPYYQFSQHPLEDGNFGFNLRHNKCEYLWKKYIDNQ